MIAISLFDYTGTMLRPWADAGHDCYAFDIQHEGRKKVDGITYTHADLSAPPVITGDIAFVSAFPPCDHLAVSGARWFKGKGLRALEQSISLFATSAEFCEASGAPYLIENPVSTISTYWRKPDHTFSPDLFTLLEPADNYTKKTCLWTGGALLCLTLKKT